MSETVKKRLFVAIDIPDEVRQLAADHTARLSKRFPDARIRWTKPGNFHLTIKFLGAVEESRIPKLCDELKKVMADVAGFRMAIADAGVFPSARRPKVLWLGVESIGGELSRLAAVIENSLAQIGFVQDDRKFSPHLTIGRARENTEASALAQAHIDSGFKSRQFAPAEIVLYESKLSRGGSIYTPICTVRLKQPID